MITICQEIRFKILASMLLCLVNLGCSANPDHKPPIEGDIAISVDSDGTICFNPKFETATLTDKPYNSLDQIKKVFISLDRVQENLQKGFIVSDESETLRIKDPKFVWAASLKNNEDSLNIGDVICIGIKNSKFNQQFKSELEEDKYYRLHVSGVTMNNKYRVSFITEFNYL